MAQPQITLNLFTSVLGDKTPLGDIAQRAIAWQRSVKSMGGSWLGSFRLVGSTHELDTWFDNHLGYHLEEIFEGDCTWEGMIYEMEYTRNGIKRMRSLDRVEDGSLFANAIKVLYIDENDVAQESSFATQSNSITQYGRKEDVLTLDGMIAATAENMRDTEILRRAWPRAFVASVGVPSEGNFIDVRVCGYAFTMNWRYVTIQEVVQDDLEDYILDIISTDCEFVSSAKATANTLQIVRKTQIPVRAYEAIETLVSLGDASNNRYRMHVIPGRQTVYEQIDTTPVYCWRDGNLYNIAGQLVPPWLVRPGVVRDLSYPSGATEPDSWLTDRRDFYIEELSVGARSGLSIELSTFKEDELVFARNEYQEWMDELGGLKIREERPLTFGKRNNAGKGESAGKRFV